MPEYEYQCEQCGDRFVVTLSITDHGRQDREHEIQCPKCGSTDVKHIIESVFVTTSKKS